MLLSRFCATIREIRDFNREKYGTNRESVTLQDSPEQKLRNVLLEILNRLPHNETLRPFVTDLLNLSMHVLNNDNEENSLICLRIIFDLHKNYRPTLDAFAQPFLTFVRKLYHNFKEMVQANFGSSAMLPAGLPAAAPAPAAPAPAAPAPASVGAAPASASSTQKAAAAAGGAQPMAVDQSKPSAKAAGSAAVTKPSGTATSSGGSIGAAGFGGDKPKSGVLVRSTDSFKVLVIISPAVASPYGRELLRAERCGTQRLPRRRWWSVLWTPGFPVKAHISTFPAALLSEPFGHFP
eukprot:SAG31_NODE_8137_length_1514_cov_1.340636_2_plen_294_part_00